MSEPEFTALGIDVGGTKTAAGIVTFPEGVVRSRRVIPTQPNLGGASVLENVCRLAQELIQETEHTGKPLQAIGLGLCELVDSRGRVMSANSFDWKELRANEELQKLKPCVFDADVRAAARAEALYGAGRGLHSFLYVTVGTGIACSLVIGGEPYPGARGATGTMASTPLGFTCKYCGKVENRTLEQIASGPGLLVAYRERASKPVETAEQVLDAARKGDPAAVEVAKAGGDALGCIVGLMISVLDPVVVIAGGGLGLTKGSYWDSFISATHRQVWSELHRDVPILHAKTGVDAGVIGAAALAWQKFTMEGNALSFP
jgi:glucokinase